MSLTAILLMIGFINLAIDIAVLYVIYKKEYPSLCDTCKHLRRKGGGIYRYDCQKRSHFDRQPKICSDWTKKKG